MKKTNFFFKSPFYKDWVFYVFLFFLAVSLSQGFSNVSSSGGLRTSSDDLISGAIDGIMRVFFAWMPVPIINALRNLKEK